MYNQAASVNTGKHRDVGPAFALKDFHNKIKGCMYDEFAFGVTSLLDIGCGRGGDLRKWYYANISSVYALDASVVSTIEARKRLSTMRKTLNNMEVEFVCDPTFGMQPTHFDQKFDAVSCMFALHYFFETEFMVHQLLYNVARSLVPGGVFFGCVPHGLRVLRLLSSTMNDEEDGNAKVIFQNTFMQIDSTKKTVLSPPCFGGIYGCTMTDTIIASTSNEYFVFENVLTKAAIAVGLHPIFDYSPKLQAQVENSPKNVFKAFLPRTYDNDVDLEIASKINCVFAFRKK